MLHKAEVQANNFWLVLILLSDTQPTMGYRMGMHYPAALILLSDEGIAPIFMGASGDSFVP